MAIDVLSNPDAVPIVVGDESDICEIRGVSGDADGGFHLLLDDHEIALSYPASENLRTAKHLLLVGITDAENITTARRVKIDNIEDGKDLSSDQRRALSKALSLGAGALGEFYTEALAEFWRSYPELSAA